MPFRPRSAPLAAIMVAMIAVTVGATPGAAGTLQLSPATPQRLSNQVQVSTPAENSAGEDTSIPDEISSPPGRSTRAARPVTQSATHKVNQVVQSGVVDLGVQASFLSREQLIQVINEAKAAGASVISTAASWSSLRPDPNKPYIWNLEDEVVDLTLARGMKVRLQAEQMPNWARDPGDPSGAWTPPRSAREVAGFAGFLKDLATRYGSKVAYIEVWNEPNITNFWGTGPNPTQFAALLKASYLAIKGASPTTTVISGGVSRNDVGFVNDTYTALAKIGGTTANHFYFDMLGVHPYSGNRSPLDTSQSWVYNSTFGTMDENFDGYERLISVMNAHGETTKQVYLTEYGFSTLPWSGYAAVSDSQRAKYLTEAFGLIAKNPRVFGLSWFYMLDTPWDGPGFALLNSSLQPSATFAALKRWSASR